MYRYILAIVALSLTTACIGNDRRPMIDPAPMPTADEAARAKYYRILENTNLELGGALLGSYRGEDSVHMFREAEACEGAACAEEYGLEEVSLQILGEDRGVERVNESMQDEEQRLWVHGAWMEHSFFAVQGVQFLDPEADVHGLTGYDVYAVGHWPGTNPDIGAVSGRWSGLMLAADLNDWPQIHDALSGDAAVVVELGGNGLRADVSLTNIVDQTGAARSDLTWEGLTVEAGRFEHDGDVTDSLSGAFFGAEHGEVAGTFFRDFITGVFGGVRE